MTASAILRSSRSVWTRSGARLRLRPGRIVGAVQTPGWLKVAAAEAERKLDLPEPVLRGEPGESDAADPNR